MKRVLRRELGLTGATMLGLGSVVGTGVFVSIGLAAGLSGYWVIAAILVAAVVATINGLNSAQLAANHAVSGGAYEYGHVFLVPWAGFAAGWVFVAAKTASSAAAAMGFAGYIVTALELDDTWRIGLGLSIVVVLALIVSFGIRRSNQANTVIVSITIIALAIFCITGGLFIAGGKAAAGDAGSMKLDAAAFLNAAAIMFVAFTGYGRVATMGEEVREPRRIIPRAIITTLVTTAVIYVVVALVAVSAAGPLRYAQYSHETAAPLEIISKDFGIPAVPTVVAIGAITAMMGVLLNLLLGVSRVILSMGRRGDLPSLFAGVSGKTGSPAPAIALTAFLILILVLLDDLRLTWSFSAFTVLLYYAINNMAALMIPREKKLFPAWLPAIGLVICLSLAWWVEWQALVAGLILIGIGIIWRIVFRSLTGSNRNRSEN